MTSLLQDILDPKANVCFLFPATHEFYPFHAYRLYNKEQEVFNAFKGSELFNKDTLYSIREDLPLHMDVVIYSKSLKQSFKLKLEISHKYFSGFSTSRLDSNYLNYIYDGKVFSFNSKDVKDEATVKTIAGDKFPVSCKFPLSETENLNLKESDYNKLSTFNLPIKINALHTVLKSSVLNPSHDSISNIFFSTLFSKDILDISDKPNALDCQNLSSIYSSLSSAGSVRIPSQLYKTLLPFVFNQSNTEDSSLVKEEELNFINSIRRNRERIKEALLEQHEKSKSLSNFSINSRSTLDYYLTTKLSFKNLYENQDYKICSLDNFVTFFSSKYATSSHLSSLFTILSLSKLVSYDKPFIFYRTFKPTSISSSDTTTIDTLDQFYPSVKEHNLNQFSGSPQEIFQDNQYTHVSPNAFTDLLTELSSKDIHPDTNLEEIFEIFDELEKSESLDFSYYRPKTAVKDSLFEDSLSFKVNKKLTRGQYKSLLKVSKSGLYPPLKVKDYQCLLVVSPLEVILARTLITKFRSYSTQISFMGKVLTIFNLFKPYININRVLEYTLLFNSDTNTLIYPASFLISQGAELTDDILDLIHDIPCYHDLVNQFTKLQ